MKGSQAVARGWKAYDRQQVTEAEAEFAKAVGESPDAAYPHLQRGLFLLRQDRFAEAAGSFEQAMEKDPLNPAPLFFLTITRELGGQTDAADSHFEQLASLSPRHQGLASLRLLKEIRRGDPLPTLKLLGFGDQTKTSKESWQSMAAGIGVGDAAWLSQDLSSSQYLLGPILAEVEQRLVPREIPQLEHTSIDLVQELERLKRPKRSFIDELKGLPVSLFKSGPKLRKGRRLLNRAMDIEDLDEQRSTLDQSIALLSAGQQLDPYSFRTAFHLGEAYLFSAKTEPGTPYHRGRLIKAEENFIDSCRFDGSNPYVLFYLALIQQLLGRPEPALACFEKATEKFTKLPEAHYGMGQCHLLLDRPQKARELMLRAVNSDLALARDRLNLFTNLLTRDGPEAFARQLPKMPPLQESSPDEPAPALAPAGESSLSPGSEPSEQS